MIYQYIVPDLMTNKPDQDIKGVLMSVRIYPEQKQWLIDQGFSFTYWVRSRIERERAEGRAATMKALRKMGPANQKQTRSCTTCKHKTLDHHALDGCLVEGCKCAELTG